MICALALAAACSMQMSPSGAGAVMLPHSDKAKLDILLFEKRAVFQIYKTLLAFISSSDL
jgi:hypothetical protein